MRVLLGVCLLLLLVGGADAQQYVPESFLNNPPTDATAIKSWTFLKESMERMGDQAADLLTVREDVGAMQSDMATQVNLWHQAKAEMMQENAKLKHEIDQLNQQVAAGAKVGVSVLNAQKAITDGKGQLEAAKVKATQHQASFASERATLQKRVEELTTRLTQVRKDSLTEQTIDNEGHTTLHNEGLVLESKATELEHQIHDVNTEIERDQKAADMKTTELSDLHAEISAQVKKLKGGVQEEKPLQDAMISMQAQLKADTTEVVTAKQEYSQVSISCKKKQSELAKVLAAEQAALIRAQEEAASYCQPVQGKNGVYKQLLQKCQAGQITPPAPPLQPAL